MRRRNLIVLAVGGVLAVVLLVLVLAPDDATPAGPRAPDWSDPTVDRAASATPDRQAPPRSEPASAQRAAPTYVGCRRVVASEPCPGATVRGHVRDGLGNPQAEVPLVLAGADGQAIARVVTDADGAFTLFDPYLDATAINIGDGPWPIPALSPREVRTLDLVAGSTRVVRGFVLDIAGEPLAGIVVKLAPMAYEGAGWTTRSDSGGAFSFIAPTTAARVEADGLELGRDRAWVGEGWEERVVELVLEPVGHITVVAQGASSTTRVSIRTEDPKALGPDRSWSMPVAPPDTTEAEPAPEVELAPELGGAHEAMSEHMRALVDELVPDAPELDDATVELEHAYEDELETEDGWPFYLPHYVAPEPVWQARHIEAAGGALGETFAVAANVWYTIVIVVDGRETTCTRLMVQAEDELTVQCGGEPASTTLSGRVVDRQGRPVPSLALWYSARNHHNMVQDIIDRTLSGPDGRFTVTFDHALPLDLELGVGDPYDVPYLRRNVSVVPGHDKDLGDLLYLVGDAVPDPWPDAAYGGIGGLVGFDDNGVTLLDMEEDSPLYLAGVERDDTIILVDGRPAAEMPDDEALVRLRGEPGTFVELRIRSAAGELYELTLERKLMAAPDETWGGDGDATHDW